MDMPTTINVPLEESSDGGIYISDTRVMLDSLILNYQQGQTPEAIQAAFPAVSLSDVYAVIAYYLANHEEVDAYMAAAEAEIQRQRQIWADLETPAQRAREDELRQMIAKQRDEGN